MKILKYGEGYPKTIVCDKCQSELEYNPDDIECSITDHDLNSGDGKIQRWQRLYINCPVCKHSILLESQVIFEYQRTLALTPTTPTKKRRWWQI